MNPLEPSKDSTWYRIVDAVVIFTIGIMLGIVISQSFSVFNIYDNGLSDPRSVDSKIKLEENGGTEIITTPKGTVRINEI